MIGLSKEFVHPSRKSKKQKFNYKIFDDDKLKEKFFRLTCLRTAYFGINDVEFMKKWLLIEGSNHFIDFFNMFFIIFHIYTF